MVTGFRTNCRLAEADWLAAEKVIRNCSSSDVTLDMVVEIGPKVETGPLRVCVTTWAPLTKIFSVAGPGEPIEGTGGVFGGRKSAEPRLGDAYPKHVDPGGHTFRAIGVCGLRRNA